MPLKKLLRHLGYMRNARRFGVRFRRHRGFELPARMRIGGAPQPLACLPGDAGMVADFFTVFLHDDYGLSQLREPVNAVLDIGGNVGFFALAARHYFPKARIHVYEPNPRVVAVLQHNTAGRDIEVFAEAVGDRAGAVTLSDTGDSNAASTTQGSGAGVEVRQAAFADVVGRLGAIDLAKIDCEGAEWAMFEVADPWTRIRRVRMEYHLQGGRTYEAAAKALDRLGFRITLHHPSPGFGMVWAENRHMT